jgi:dsRNA-specific ribonuclease
MQKNDIFENYHEAKNLLKQDPKLIFALNKDNFKTPVTYLNELCDKLKLPKPDFEFDGSNGPSHRPKFECRIKNYTVSYGLGFSKQSSKDYACLNMLISIMALTNGQFANDLEIFT